MLQTHALVHDWNDAAYKLQSWEPTHLSMTGMMRPRSLFGGRNCRSMKSLIRPFQSRLARWMVALTIACRSEAGISATNPKSRRASLPAWGPSVTCTEGKVRGLTGKGKSRNPEGPAQSPEGPACLHEGPSVTCTKGQVCRLTGRGKLRCPKGLACQHVDPSATYTKEKVSRLTGRGKMDPQYKNLGLHFVYMQGCSSMTAKGSSPNTEKASLPVLGELHLALMLEQPFMYSVRKCELVRLQKDYRQFDLIDLDCNRSY